MMMKSNIRAQRATSSAVGLRKSHVMPAIKHSMPAHIQPTDKPDALQQLGRILSATALAASLMFGGKRLKESYFFYFFFPTRCLNSLHFYYSQHRTC
jgi:hypothetical protein